MAEQRGGIVVFADQIQIDVPLAGGRVFIGGIAQLVETAGAQRQRHGGHQLVARIADFGTHRHAGQANAPVGGAGDQTNIESIPRPINAAIGEQVAAERARIGRRLFTGDVEAREVQPAIVIAAGRQEGDIPFLFHQEHHRLALVGVHVERRETHVAVGPGGLAEQRHAVFGHYRHVGAADRRAALNRLHEDVARLILRALGDDAQIGHHHKARIADVGLIIPGALVRFLFWFGTRLFRRRFPVRLPFRQRQQEHPAMGTGVGGEITGEIDALIVHFPRPLVVKRRLVFEMLSEILIVEPVEFRGRIFPAFEGDDVLQLARDHPLDVQPQARHVARRHADLFVAVDRQQRACGHELQRFRELRHFDHPINLLRHFVTAGGDQLVVYLDQHEAVRRGFKAEAELRLVGLFRLVKRQWQYRRLRQHVFTDAVDRPLIEIFGIVGGLGIAWIVLRQQPGFGGPRQLFILHRIAEADHQRTLPLAAVGIHDLGAGVAQRQAVQRRDFDPVAFRLFDRIAGRRRFNALADDQMHRAALIQRLQRLGMHPGVQFFLVIDQREVQLFLGGSAAFFQPQRNLFFKAGDVDRRVELQIENRAAFLRILRIAVILGLPQTVIERGHGEGIAGFGQFDLRRQQGGGLKGHAILRAHRQRLFRREQQRRLIAPCPLPFRRRLQSDAGAHGFTHCSDRRDRPAEGQAHRLRHLPGGGVIYRLGVGKRCADLLNHHRRRFDRLRPVLPPVPAVKCAACGTSQQQQA